MRKIFKNFISSITVLAVLCVATIPAFAQTGLDENSTVINGVNYQIEEKTDSNGNKVVIVIGDGEKNTVINTGNELIIETETSQGVEQSAIEIQQNYSVKNKLNTSAYLNSNSNGSLITPYWNYYYYYDTSSSSNGTHWYMSAGDQGTCSAYDRNNSTARGYAESFMSSVQSISNQQLAAVAAMGAAGAGIVAAALTAPTGIGFIIGVVVAAGGSATSAAIWVAAWTSSLDANYNFNQFKAAL